MSLTDAIKLRIIELCKQKNFTINKLAVNSGLNPSTVRNIIKARCKAPNSQTIYYLCIGFGITLQDFFNSNLFNNLDDND